MPRETPTATTTAGRRARTEDATTRVRRDARGSGPLRIVSVPTVTGIGRTVMVSVRMVTGIGRTVGASVRTVTVTGRTVGASARTVIATARIVMVSVRTVTATVRTVMVSARTATVTGRTVKASDRLAMGSGRLGMVSDHSARASDRRRGALHPASRGRSATTPAVTGAGRHPRTGVRVEVRARAVKSASGRVTAAPRVATAAPGTPSAR